MLTCISRINTHKIYVAFFILISCTFPDETYTCESYRLKGKVKTLIHQGRKAIEFDTNGKVKDGTQDGTPCIIDKRNPFFQEPDWTDTYDKYGRAIEGNIRSPLFRKFLRKVGTWTMTYDTINRIKKRSDYDLDGKLFGQYIVKYDNRWRIIKTTDYFQMHGNLPLSRSNYNWHDQAYTYDDQGNYKMVYDNGDTTFYQYEYDKEGNWIYLKAVHKIIGESVYLSEEKRIITYY